MPKINLGVASILWSMRVTVYIEHGDVERRMQESEQAYYHERAVIPGFYGSDEEGNIVTFSRGGSDMTGSLVAAAALADLYENWTDVDGVLLADPLVVNNPLTVPLITYKEVRELSAMGTEVVHEDVIFPVQKLGIPINIKNTDKPETPGTLIVKSDDNMDSVLKISGISGGKGYAGFLIEKDKLSEEPELRTKVMDIFSLCGISIVNMVSGIDSLDVFVSEKDVRGKIRELTARIKSSVGGGSGNGENRPRHSRHDQ